MNLEEWVAALASAKDEVWQDRALCAQVDADIFFPDKGGSTRDAKSVCLRCDVKDDCLEYALGAQERFGIWGGLSERERRKYLERRQGRGLTPDQIKALFSLLREGVDLDEVAQRVDVTRTTVERYRALLDAESNTKGAAA